MSAESHDQLLLNMEIAMANSLEARSSRLDKGVMQTVAVLPASDRVHGRASWDIFKDLVPPSRRHRILYRNKAASVSKPRRSPHSPMITSLAGEAILAGLAQL
jgi:hypothetical protein